MDHGLALLCLLLGLVALRLYTILPPRAKPTKRAARSRQATCSLAVFLGSGEPRGHAAHPSKLNTNQQAAIPARHSLFSPASISTAILLGRISSVKATSSVPRKPSASNQTRLRVLRRTMSVVLLPCRGCLLLTVCTMRGVPLAAGWIGTLQYCDDPTRSPCAPVTPYHTPIICEVTGRVHLSYNLQATVFWQGICRRAPSEWAWHMRHALCRRVSQQGKPPIPYQRVLRHSKFIFASVSRSAVSKDNLRRIVCSGSEIVVVW